MDYIPELFTLKEILFERKSFEDAYFMAKVNERISAEGSKRLKERVKGILSSYQTLSYLTLNALPQYDANDDEFLLSLIVLYILKMENKEIKNLATNYASTFLKCRMQGDSNSNFKALEEMAKQKNNNLPLYCLSELPKFLYKLLLKEYDNEQVEQIVCNLKTQSLMLYGKAKDKTDPRFTKVDEEDYYTVTTSQIPVNSEDYYPLSYLAYKAYQKSDKANIGSLSLICGDNRSYSFIPFVIKNQEVPLTQCTSVYPDSISYRLAKDISKKYNLKLKALCSSPELMKTYLDMSFFDSVICFGTNTKLGLAKKHFEVLPSLRESDINESKNKAMRELQEASYFVKNNGQLIFISYSIIKEESSDVVADFILHNKNYTLEFEENILPSSNYNDFGYFALLRRVK